MGGIDSAPLNEREEATCVKHDAQGRYSYRWALLLSAIPFPGLVRFYTGRAVSGFAQLLLFPFGVGMVWWFVDFADVLMHEYRDADGYRLRDYSMELALILGFLGVVIFAVIARCSVELALENQGEIKQVFYRVTKCVECVEIDALKSVLSSYEKLCEKAMSNLLPFFRFLTENLVI